MCYVKYLFTFEIVFVMVILASKDYKHALFEKYKLKRKKHIHQVCCILFNEWDSFCQF